MARIGGMMDDVNAPPGSITCWPGGRARSLPESGQGDVPDQMVREVDRTTYYHLRGTADLMLLTVVSPHLDDAILSIGGTINLLSRRGIDVRIATVFAGDPADEGPPSYWDASRGMPTQGESVRLRRVEDQRAAEHLGATTTWLPFPDDGYIAARDPDVIWHALAPHLADADGVLLPGWPLSHADHRYTTLLSLRELDPMMPIGFYAELPYAAQPVQLVKAAIRKRDLAPIRQAYRDEIRWRHRRLAKADRRAKREAQLAYAGELGSLGIRGRWGRKQAALTRGEWIGIGRRVPFPGESSLG